MAPEISISHEAGAAGQSIAEPAQERALAEGGLSRQVLKRLDAISDGQVALEARLLSSLVRLEQVLERCTASTADTSLWHGLTTQSPSSVWGLSPVRAGTLSDNGTDQHLVEKEDCSFLPQAGVPSAPSCFPLFVGPAKTEEHSLLPSQPIVETIEAIHLSFPRPLSDAAETEAQSLLPSQPITEKYCNAVSAKRSTHASKPLPMLLGTSPRPNDLVSFCESADQIHADTAKQCASSGTSDAGKQAEPRVSIGRENSVIPLNSMSSDASTTTTVLSFSDPVELRQDGGFNSTADRAMRQNGFASSSTTALSFAMSTTARMSHLASFISMTFGTQTVSTSPPRTSRPAIRRGGKLNVDDTKEGKCRVPLVALVRSPIFGYLICALLLANAATVGMEVNFKAANSGQQVPTFFRISEVAFCILFVTELALRGYVHRTGFFHGEGWQWNVFEAIAVGLQFLELIMNAAASMRGWSISHISNLARMLQLLRIFRVLRIVHFVRRLDKLVYLIIASWHYFLWTLALLMLLTYMLGVFLTQLVVEHGESHPDMVAPGTQLHRYFASIGISVLSLFQAISGGIEWGDIVAPLAESISSVLAPLVSFYVAFVLLVVLNLVTGVYVEAAQGMTKKDKDNDLLQKVRLFFTQTDSDDQGSITWAEFRQQLNKPGMQKLLTDIGLGLCKPEEFFCLLDSEGTGQISADDIAYGGMLLQQPARAIDVALLLHNTKQTTVTLRRLLHKLEMRIAETVKSAGTESVGKARDFHRSRQGSQNSSTASLGEFSLDDLS